jgi:ComF family protein
MVFIGMSKAKLVDFLAWLKQLFLASVFPKFCLFCGKEGVWICENCFSKLLQEPILACPNCKSENPFGQTCASCREEICLDYQVSILDYQKEQVKKLIQKFKYDYVEDLSTPISRIIKNFQENFPDAFPKKGIVVPVPLHIKRYKQRGFNQASIIAEKLAKHYDFELKDLLRRNKNTNKQADLDKQQRQENIKGAFELKQQKNISHNSVILVDDVFTTGSTLNECAKVLKQHKIDLEIFGFTLARGI